MWGNGRVFQRLAPQIDLRRNRQGHSERFISREAITATAYSGPNNLQFDTEKKFHSVALPIFFHFSSRNLRVRTFTETADWMQLSLFR